MWLQTNYLPEITGSDNGMWSRIRVVPFTETFTGRGDPELDTTLAGESAGILNWMIEGCLQWQRIGLKEPETVVRATLDYRNSEDVLTRFATDTGLQFAKNTTLIDAELKAAITQWAAEEGVDKPNAKKTNAWMKANGCRESRENYTRNDGKTSKRKIWKGAALQRPGASPSESAETQANTEENPLPGRTGPTPPVNPPMVPRVQTNRTTTSSASHRDGESAENPTPVGERARIRAP